MSADPSTEIDPALLQEFLAEGLESLDAIDPLFVRLESAPDDLALVDGIFRPVHSVKGNSGFFGLTNIKSFAHVMESILGDIRARRRSATPRVVDLLLKGVDFLRGMLNRLATGDFSKDFSEAEQAHFNLLTQASEDADASEAEDDGERENADIAELALAVKAAFDEFKVAIDDHGLGLLGEAIDQLYLRLCPPVSTPLPDDLGTAAIWTLSGVEVTETVQAMESFIGDIGAAEKAEAACEKFVAALDALSDQARNLGGHQPLVTALDVLKDEFETLHRSGIGFDRLMAELMRERLQAVTRQLDRFTIGAGSGMARSGASSGMGAERYALAGEDVTDWVEGMSLFLSKVSDNHNNADKTRHFRKGIEALRALAKRANNDATLMALRDLESDFETLHGSEVGFDPLMTELMRERIVSVRQSVDHVAAPPPDTATRTVPATPAVTADAASPEAGHEGGNAPAGNRGGAGAGKEASGKMIRVAEEKVDQFMNFVGELIITGEVFAYIQKKLEAFPEARQVSQEFKNANISFNELSSDLQRSLMEVRRVPLRSMMQKIPRIIRDTASQLGKHVDLEVTGEDVQIDKSLLEGLESPLVHMIRNSVDHGIEMPEERLSAGKSEKGRVAIEAKATEEHFTLTISDDGKGLDLEAIKAKAVSRGIISEDAARQMADREAGRLIFSAGLSTAKVVTDVSGRGVGMDVVLSNITKMGGNIGVESVKGQGSVFTITLPMTVTLAVIDGLVARIAEEQFIVPLTDVLESVRPSPEHLHTIQGRGEVLDVRGELQPLVRLNEVLGIRGESMRDPCGSTVVLVQGKRGVHGAFMFDEVLGQQSVVVKDLGKQFSELASIQGGSILGNGRVGLVLNTNGILEMVGIQKRSE